MAKFNTSNIAYMDTPQLGSIVEAVQDGSAVAALSAAEPMIFGDHAIVTFQDPPRAEFVAEGGEKGSQTGVFSTKEVTPRTTHVTMRFSNQLKWADDDHQLQIVTTMVKAAGQALSRALDFGVLYRRQPTTGDEIAAWPNYLNSTTNRLVAGASPDQDIREAAGLVVGKKVKPTGIALDPSYSWKIANERDKDGKLLYPNLGLGQNITEFAGTSAFVTDTVGGAPEIPGGTGVHAIVGDWQNGVRWGIQKEIPYRVIDAGDPDGQGDLNRTNEWAVRIELVYAWYVFEDKFAVVETPLVP